MTVSSPLPLSPRENYQRFMRGEKPLWMPTQRDVRMFTPRILPDNPARGFVLENSPFDLSLAGGPDMFGVRWTYVPEVMGSMTQAGNPLVKDLDCWEDYVTFPDLDRFDWAGSARENEAYLHSGDANSLVVLSGLFERLVSFVDMTDALIALVDEDSQEAVHRLFDRLCSFYDEYFARCKEWFDIDQILFHDDWGSQRSPLFSLSACREMLVPYLRRIAESAHSRGLFFELHSCGKNELLVPAMIEAGVDAWNGQTLNDKAALFDLYGEQIILAIEPTTLGADCRDEEALRADVTRFVEKYAPGGRVICSLRDAPPQTADLVRALSRELLDS